MEEITAEKNGEVTQLRDLNENDLKYFMYCRISTIENYLKGITDYPEAFDYRNNIDLISNAEVLVDNFRREMNTALEAINNQVGVILLKQNPRYEEYGFKARLQER